MQVTGSQTGLRSRRWESATLLTYSRYRPGVERRPAPWNHVRHQAKRSGHAEPRDESGPGAGLRSYLFGLGVALTLAVALSWSFSTSARLGYRIESLKREIAALETVQEKLSFELSGLKSMVRVEREATERLGLVRPAYVRVGVDTVGASGQASGYGTAATDSIARLICLSDAGSDRAGSSSDGLSPERSLARSLWDRLYRWLTGESKAEAHSRD